jgi:large subunit ribosomal protein L15
MAFKLNKLRPAAGANRKHKRVGRGPGSGHGKTACRGHKGQLSRSGASVRPGFEGGQMPLHRRLPKRGFTNIFRKEVAEVNIGRLAIFPSGATVDPQALLDRKLIRRAGLQVKILGDGEIKHPLKVMAHFFSKAAAERIQQAGGTAEVIA